MFISEIPVRLRADKTIRWVTELTASTTVDDVIQTILQPPKEDPSAYALYICLGRQRQLLSKTSRIYHIVARHGSVRRLCFELRQIPIKKRVRFADQVPEEEMTTMSLEKRLEQLKENFQKHVQRKQECYTKRSSILKRYRDHLWFALHRLLNVVVLHLDRFSTNVQRICLRLFVFKQRRSSISHVHRVNPASVPVHRMRI